MGDNVAVLHTSAGTASVVFDNLSSLVETVAEFIDNQDGWDKRCLVIIVHRNGQTIKWRFDSIGELVTLTRGLLIANWLFTDEGSEPTMAYLSWLQQASDC